MTRSPWHKFLPYLIAIAVGTGYGVLARGFTQFHVTWLFSVMSVNFLFVIPAVMGFLAVYLLEKPRVWHVLFLAPVPCILTVTLSGLIGWEGSICIVMALPILIALAIVGGAIALSLRRTSKSPAPANRAALGALVLPFVLAPIENSTAPPTSLRTVETEIAIDAMPDRVWSQIVQVPAISKDELRPSLASRLGFPRPIAATLDHPGVGGVRRATFEGGVLFLETITDWRENERLRFTIKADTHSIPPTTLDEHVTIGGESFDVLTGTYSIERRGAGVNLHLASELRVSTRFNLYAGPWADALMQSIQEQILEVLKTRCERSR